MAAPLLVLDLDGTLVDSVPDLAAALNRRLAASGLPGFSDPEVAAMVGDGARVLLERAFAARGRTASGGTDDAAFGAALEAFLADYTANAAVLTRPFPGAVPALERLRGDGWRLAVCTNKPEDAAHALLEALDLARFFAAVGGGDSFPTRKPDPAHLLATVAAAQGDPGAAVMAGDHANDVRAAQGAGIPCVFAAWGYGPPGMAEGAAAVAQRFGDLPAIARALLANGADVRGASA